MVSDSKVPDPPSPFRPLTEKLPKGSVLYRVHSRDRVGNEFNPKCGPQLRFSFFCEVSQGDKEAPPVPVWYGGASEGVAICESLLHDKPLKDALLMPEEYIGRILTTVTTDREFSLASFTDPGCVGSA